MMRVRPVQDQILIEVDPLESLSEGRHGERIELPPLAQDAAHTGTVAAAGPGRVNRKGRFVPTTVKKGDRVWFRWRRGVQVYLGGKPHLFIREGGVVLDPRELGRHGIEAVLEATG